MGYDRTHDIPGDFDPLDFTWDTDCGRTAPSEWCFYAEPHQHGFGCDKTCPCRTGEPNWRKSAHNNRKD